MDWVPFVVDKVAAPALTALGGFVGAAHRFSGRLKSLEEEFRALRADVLEETKAQNAAWRLELGEESVDFGEKVRDLEKKLERVEQAFQRFQIEEQRQWQQIERTLGQIEGALKTRTKA